MTDDFSSTVRWPLRTERWPRTVLVGALLVATIPLVLPTVLLAGYAVRLLRTDFAEGSLPAFDDPRALANTGLRAAAVVVAYHLPAAVLLTVGVGAASTALRWGAPGMLRPAAVVGSFSAGALGPASLGGIVALVGVLSLPVCGYVATVAVTAYATTDDVAEAFAFDRIRRRALAATTLQAWLLGSLVTLTAGVCTFVLLTATAAVPGVGRLLAGAVRFYGGIVALAVWSETLPGESHGEAATATTADPA